MVSSLSSSFTLNQTHQLVPIHNSLFLNFSPPKHRQLNVRRAVAAKLSATRHDEPRAKTTLTETSSRFRSSSSPRRDERRYERKRATSSSPVDEKGSNQKSCREEEEDEKENGKKGPKKSKTDPREIELRIGLDMCSKRGDVKRAIELFDWAERQGIKLAQYHYNVLLYLCSSAATGVIRPAKSGTAARTITGLEAEPEEAEEEEIRVDDELRRHARKRGFEIFENMRSDEVAMSEAALTSVARMAEDGDTAFKAVEQMKSLGISPKLRSYGPALSAFCNSGDIEKAFAVEAHMVESGVCPEEPELQALLRLSVSAGDSKRVYSLLHKLRSAVRKVSPQTGELIAGWFASKAASRVGKRRDEEKMRAAVAAGGGGWHGLGWVGRGSWSVVLTSVGTDDGLCRCCGQKLSIIDLDPQETESFAESVASIATQRDKHLSFPKFQKWLDYYGPFEAVVDGANIGLFSQKRFMPSKINAVVNGIRQTLPSKKWPLIVLHNRRIDGPKMNEPFNRALVEKWRNADAIYATPTGSNDDWYWLYAAIKFKSYLVTNDEMRDHTFQLLGNDFFPRWKERHQVRFTFTDTGPEFLMPPPYSVVIQESENGHWHIPISSEEEHEAKRPWLCVTRAKSRLNKQTITQVMEAKARGPDSGNHEPTNGESERSYKRLRDILSGSMSSITPQLESSEEISGCAIDFQI